jgi:hypothetical protein
MSAEEFIKKWNVGFESKEQEIEFAHEMKSDLEAYHNAKLKEMMPSDEDIDSKAKELAVREYGDNPYSFGGQRDGYVEGFKQGIQYRDRNLENQVVELLGLTGCKNVLEVVEKWKAMVNRNEAASMLMSFEADNTNRVAIELMYEYLTTTQTPPVQGQPE